MTKLKEIRELCDAANMELNKNTFIKTNWAKSKVGSMGGTIIPALLDVIELHEIELEIRMHVITKLRRLTTDDFKAREAISQVTDVIAAVELMEGIEL